MWMGRLGRMWLWLGSLRRSLVGRLRLPRLRLGLR